MLSTTELETKFDDVARTLVYQPVLFNDCHEETLNRIYKNADGIGIDLLSTDINRGRDHGIPPYYIFLQKCFGHQVKTFNDLSPFLTDDVRRSIYLWFTKKINNIFCKKVIADLKTVYKSVFDIDLYVGAALEEREEDSIVGTTIACIVNEQFYRYAKGDRYFFNNPSSPNPFTISNYLIFV